MINNILLLVVLIFGMNISSRGNDDEQLTDKKTDKKNVASCIVKIGCVDFNEVLKTYTLAQKSYAEFSDYTKQIQNNRERQERELHQLCEDFEKNAQSLTEEQKNKQREEINKKVMEFRNYAQGIDQLLIEKEKQLFDPIHDQIDSVIQEISKSEGYDFVFNKKIDIKVPILFYVKPVFDITKKVCDKLKKMSPPVETPVAVANPKKPVVKGKGKATIAPGKEMVQNKK